MSTTRVCDVTAIVECSEKIDLWASCGLLWRHGDDLMDRWVDDHLVRMLPIAGRPCAVRISQPAPTGPLHAVAAPSHGTHISPDQLSAAVAGQFIYADPAWQVALGRDPALAAKALRLPGIRPLRLGDPLYSLVRSITAQQVNLAFATRIRARLAVRYGVCQRVGGYDVYRLDPAALADARIPDLMTLQLSRRKAEYIVGVANAVHTGAIDLAHLRRLDTEQLIVALTRFRGIGRWTAEWFAARVLGRSVVVAGDLAVRKAVAAHFGCSVCTEARVRELTEHWGRASLLAQHLVLEPEANEAPARAARTERGARKRKVVIIA